MQQPLHKTIKKVLTEVAYEQTGNFIIGSNLDVGKVGEITPGEVPIRLNFPAAKGSDLSALLANPQAKALMDAMKPFFPEGIEPEFRSWEYNGQQDSYCLRWNMPVSKTDVEKLLQKENEIGKRENLKDLATKIYRMDLLQDSQISPCSPVRKRDPQGNQGMEFPAGSREAARILQIMLKVNGVGSIRVNYKNPDGSETPDSYAVFVRDTDLPEAVSATPRQLSDAEKREIREIKLKNEGRVLKEVGKPLQKTLSVLLNRGAQAENQITVGYNKSCPDNPLYCILPDIEAAALLQAQLKLRGIATLPFAEGSPQSGFYIGMKPVDLEVSMKKLDERLRLVEGLLTVCNVQGEVMVDKPTPGMIMIELSNEEMPEKMREALKKSGLECDRADGRNIIISHGDFHQAAVLRVVDKTKMCYALQSAISEASGNGSDLTKTWKLPAHNQAARDPRGNGGRAL